MKSLVFAFAVLAAGLIGSAKAGEVSKSTMGAMGFGGATIMSDHDGMAIRGKGTSASVWGTSSANFNSRDGDSSATNGYQAAANNHRSSSKAEGSSNSYAGNVSSLGHHFSVTKNIAGGSASAYAR